MIGPFASHPRGTVPVRMLPIAQRLIQDGHETFIVLPPYDNPQQSGCLTFLDGVPVHNVHVASGPPVLSHFVTAMRLVERTLSLRPDIVHVFKPRGLSGLAAMTLLGRRKLGLKVGIVLDTDDWEGRGGFYDYWRSHNLYPPYQLAFADFQDRWIPARVDAITTASRMLQARIWSLGVPPSRVFYVPNGPRPFQSLPDEESMKRARTRLGLQDRPVMLLFTSFEFRPERAVRILRSVRESVDNVKLLVVGRGISGEENRLEEVVNRNGLAEHVVFLGWIEHQDLPPYLRLGDVAMYPLDDTLLNRSKCPGKLVELMSLGMPVVADRVGQIAEYIENGVSGLLVDPEDDQCFASNLVRVLTTADLRTALGANAADRIGRVFNWDRLVMDVIEAYAIAGRRSGLITSGSPLP